MQSTASLRGHTLGRGKQMTAFILGAVATEGLSWFLLPDLSDEYWPSWKTRTCPQPTWLDSEFGYLALHMYGLVFVYVCLGSTHSVPSQLSVWPLPFFVLPVTFVQSVSINLESAPYCSLLTALFPWCFLTAKCSEPPYLGQYFLASSCGEITQGSIESLGFGFK